MKKYFIYYSLTGNGDYLGELFKNKGYEIIKVETLKNIGKIGFFKMMKYGKDAWLNKKEKIKELKLNIENDDLVIIGSPIWNDRLSTPINMVLSILKLNKENTRFVLYPAGSSTKKSLGQIEKLGFKLSPIIISNPLKKKEEAIKIIEEEML